MAKRLLSQKDVSANYLKYLIPEFRNMDIKEIITYIEDYDNETIIGLPTIDESETEGKIIYDLYFKVRNPDNLKTIYINIEPQYDDSKYDMLNRLEYYLSRILYRQKNNEFHGSEYDDLKKIYSICIVFNSNNNKNQIITNEKAYKLYKYNPNNNNYLYDETYKHDSLLNTYLINLDKDYDYNTSGVFELSALLFGLDKSINQEYRLQKLKDDYDIIVDRKELIEMCSLAEGFELKGRQEGINIGKAEGLEIGAINTASSVVYNYIEATKSTVDAAISLLKIDDSIKEEVIKKVKEKLN